MSEQAELPGVPPASAPQSRPQMFEGVQILRGIAASMVVFHHMCWAINTYHPQPSALAGYRRLAEVGAAGVDIFFCISGLVIVHAAKSLPAGWKSARTFAWRRILRVMPPYWIFTAALLVLWAVGIGLRELNVTPGLVAASLLLVPYPKTTMQGGISYHPILDVGWTLTFEMYFYTTCSIIIALAGGRRIWPWSVAFLAAFALASWGLSGAGSVASSILASPLLVEFLLGVALARFVAGRRSVPIGWTLIAAGTAAMGASVYLPDPMAWRLLCWGVPGALLVAGSLLLPVTLASRWSRFLAFMGTASYTIYLVHPFFTLITGTLLKRGVMTGVPSDPLLLVLTAVAIMGSALTYFVVEGPLIHMLKPRSRTAAAAREVLQP